MEDVIIDNQPVSVIVNKSKVTKVKMRGMGRYFFSLLVKSVILLLLLSINFCLYAKSGNYLMFIEQMLPVPEVMGILKVFFGISFCLMFLLSFSNWLQNLLLAVVSAWLMVAMMNQFALFDVHRFLDGFFFNYFGYALASMMMGISHIVVSIIGAIVVLMYLGKASRSSLLYLIGVMLLINGVILFNAYMDRNNNQNFIYRYDMESKEAGKGKKFIHIMMANAGSYNYLDEMSDKNSKDNSKIENLKKIMLGFYADNNFELYPNAYVKYDNLSENQVEALNLGADGLDKNILENVVKNGSWQFSKIDDKELYLKNNQLNKMFKQAGYKVAAYQSRGLEMCKVNNEQAVERCVDKNNNPAEIDVLVKGEANKKKIILAQWLESTGLLNDSKGLYGILNLVTQANKIPVIGTSYAKLYVVNSFKTLDLLEKDIAKDKGNIAYFVYVDLPADMFVYNEFCMVKPVNKWQVMHNQPWQEKETASKMQERREAYAEQYACLFGKLQKFIDGLKSSGDIKNSVIVLQGLSAPEDRENNEKDRPELKFGAQKMVNLAIFDPKQKEFMVKNEICLASDEVKSYLSKGNKCKEFKGLKYQDEEIKELDSALKNKSISVDDVNAAKNYYKHWYVYWQEENGLKKTTEKEPSKQVNVKKKAEIAAITDSINVSENKVIDKEIKVLPEDKPKSLKAEMMKNPVVDAEPESKMEKNTENKEK